MMLKPSEKKYYDVICSAQSVYNKNYDRNLCVLIQLEAKDAAAPAEKYVTFG